MDASSDEALKMEKVETFSRTAYGLSSELGPASGPDSTFLSQSRAASSSR
jgi:hypothetical protein